MYIRLLHIKVQNVQLKIYIASVLFDENGALGNEKGLYVFSFFKM